MKISIRNLKKIFIEEGLLREEGENKDVVSEGKDSLDSQVDRYLAEYESEARSMQAEGLDFRMLTRRLLSEESDDEGGDAPDAATDVPTKMGLDDINVESFTNGVVRLIDNYDSLLEVRNTLFRRAKGFLTKSYSPEVLESFERLMRDEHDIEDGKTSDEVESDKFVAPPADRAGEGGAGGAGGPA